MKSKKFKMIFDATILANGADKYCGRSGIYFVAYNLFKQFVKSGQFNIVLYCQKSRYANLCIVLKKYFPDKNFDIITDKPLTVKTNIYEQLKRVKSVAKSNGEYLFKVLIQLCLYIISLLIFFEKINNKNKLNKYKRYDIFFSPAYEIPSPFNKQLNMKKFIILYDTVPLLFPHLNPASRVDSWWQKLVKKLNAKDTYFAISDSTKNDFLKNFPKIDANKIHTTLLACDESFRKDLKDINKVKEKYNIPKDSKYIFSLCNLDPRKNLIRTVKTFVDFVEKHNIDNLYFVLGGSAFPQFVKEFENAVENLDKYKNKIIKAGYVDDEDLAPLYSGAEWFVYTSQYEGFGLPPLEAMSCGCPVITSNNSSLPEVVGDAGIMIDWDSDEQHIEAYEKYYFDNGLRMQNAQKGLERSKLFSWEKCAERMIEVMVNEKDDIEPVM